MIGLKFQTAPGGKGANPAVHCARLGTDVPEMINPAPAAPISYRL